MSLASWKNTHKLFIELTPGPIWSAEWFCGPREKNAGLIGSALSKRLGNNGLDLGYDFFSFILLKLKLNWPESSFSRIRNKFESDPECLEGLSLFR